MHKVGERCSISRDYSGGTERALRSKFAWTKKSQEIREKANNLCEVCRDKGIYIYDNLEVHHITKVKDDESLLLDNWNLICLCQECHKQADKGEINKEYLLELAERRESK